MKLLTPTGALVAADMQSLHCKRQLNIILKTPCGDDRRTGMPVEFLPKDERSLQGHLGPHSLAPDVGGGDDGADDEAGFDRGG